MEFNWNLEKKFNSSLVKPRLLSLSNITSRAYIVKIPLSMLRETDDIMTHASVWFKCMSAIKLSNEWTSIILFSQGWLGSSQPWTWSLLGLLWSWMYTSFASYFNISIQVKPPDIALNKLFHAYLSFHGLEEGLASPSTSPWAVWLPNFPGVPCHSQNSSYFWKSGFHSAITNWFPQIFVINSETLLIRESFLIPECASVYHNQN